MTCGQSSAGHIRPCASPTCVLLMWACHCLIPPSMQDDPRAFPDGFLHCTFSSPSWHLELFWPQCRIFYFSFAEPHQVSQGPSRFFTGAVFFFSALEPFLVFPWFVTERWSSEFVLLVISQHMFVCSVLQTAVHGEYTRSLDGTKVNFLYVFSWITIRFWLPPADNIIWNIPESHRHICFMADSLIFFLVRKMTF